MGMDQHLQYTSGGGHPFSEILNLIIYPMRLKLFIVYFNNINPEFLALEDKRRVP